MMRLERSQNLDCRALKRAEPGREGEFIVRWDLDGDALVGTRVYTDHDEAVEDAAQVNDVLVLPLVIRGASRKSKRRARQ